mmetsp:Transcript_18219/g.56073  ORF Transcript_18219/g.56073 Transcript_18219/m.56073 type:complete len:200 (-) Transcript_18219:192-791(-)
MTAARPSTPSRSVASDATRPPAASCDDAPPAEIVATVPAPSATPTYEPARSSNAASSAPLSTARRPVGRRFFTASKNASIFRVVRSARANAARTPPVKPMLSVASAPAASSTASRSASGVASFTADIRSSLKRLLPVSRTEPCWQPSGPRSHEYALTAILPLPPSSTAPRKTPNGAGYEPSSSKTAPWIAGRVVSPSTK